MSTHHRQGMTDQSNNYTQLQLDKTISLLELLAGVWVRVTSRAATILKKPTLAWVTALKSDISGAL